MWLEGTEGALTPVGRVFVSDVAMVFDVCLGRRSAGQVPTCSRTV